MARLTLEQLGPLVQQQRGNRGLRQIASEIGISAATLSRVEAGKQPDLGSFTKICSWLGVDPGEVLGYKSTANAAGTGSQKNEMLAHFKAGSTMSAKTAQHLGALILAIHQAANTQDGQ